MDTKLYKENVDIADPKRMQESDFASRLGLEPYPSPFDLSATRTGFTRERQIPRLNTDRNEQIQQMPLAQAPLITNITHAPVKEREGEQRQVEGFIDERIIPSIRTREEMRRLEEKAEVQHISADEIKKTYEKRLMRSADLVPQQREKASPKQELSKNTKLLMTLYVAVALALATAIIITGIFLGKLNTQVSALETDLSAKQTMAVELERELVLLENDAVIAGIAQQKGFEQITNQTPLTLLELNEVQEYSAHTNWFDKVCKFVSNLFGG